MDMSQHDNDSQVDPSDPTKHTQEKQEELRTAGIPPHDGDPYNENKIRSQWNPPQPQRPHY
jgi:hypothetical protein